MKFLNMRGMFWLVLLVSCAASYPSNSSRGDQAAVKLVLEAADTAQEQRLSAEGVSVLHSIVDGGKLPDLHRPSFEDLIGEAKEVDASAGDSLAWVSLSNRRRGPSDDPFAGGGRR